MKNKLNIQSIFDSIDGEYNGFNGAGELCTFIRLKGCNLRCRWCDTKYAQESEPANWMTIDEIVKQVHFPKITITGGEALLQRKEIEKLCSILIWNKGCKVSIETNGTIVPEYFWDNLRYVVDWKLPSSGMEDKMNLDVFGSLRDIDVIKFVIADEKDYQRACELIRNFPWRARKVMSPVANTSSYAHLVDTDFGFSYPLHAGLGVSMSWPRQLVETMIRDRIPAQFSLQLHKILWPGAEEEK